MADHPGGATEPSFDEWLKSMGGHPDRLERLSMRQAWDAALRLSAVAINTANPGGRSSLELSELKPDGNKDAGRSGAAIEEGGGGAGVARRAAFLAGSAERSARPASREADQQDLTGEEGVSAPSILSTGGVGETPRTDAAVCNKSEPGSELVPAHFARHLERELIEEKQSHRLSLKGDAATIAAKDRRIAELEAIASSSSNVPAIEITVRQAVIDWNRAQKPMPLSIDNYQEGDVADAVLRALHLLRLSATAGGKCAGCGTSWDAPVKACPECGKAS